MTKDWKGKPRDLFRLRGATGHSDHSREYLDYYATEPLATELLLKLEQFDKNIWECACGQGHISEVLVKNNYNVRSTDLVDRGYGQGGIDFIKEKDLWDGDIITNPPCRYAHEFIEHALKVVTDGHKIAVFLRITFLEGKKRRKLYNKYPPKLIYVASTRLKCSLGGKFNEMSGSAACYAWFIWEKGFTGVTQLKWFN